MQSNRNSSSLLAIKENGILALEVCQFLTRLNKVLCNPAIVLLGFYLIDLKFYVHAKPCMLMFIGVLFTIAKVCKQSSCLSIGDGQMNDTNEITAVKRYR